MKLFKYSKFTNEFKINENLDQAKKLLRDTYKTNKLALSIDKSIQSDPSGLFLFNKEGDNLSYKDLGTETIDKIKAAYRDFKITPEENSRVERGEVMKMIRDLIGDKLGYAYLFTYFLVVEKVSVDDLKLILSKLIEFKDLLNAKNPVDGKPLLRRPIANYIDTNVSNNSENLIDDLENINLYKSTKKLYNEMTPELKKDYETQPPVIKKQVDDLSLAFSKLGMEDGKLDKVKQEKLWRLFFGEIKILQDDVTIRGKEYKKGDKVYSGQMVRFKTIREFVKAAQNFLKNIDNTETVKFYEAIEKCNEKYPTSGVKVCFDEQNLLILEIKSFQANQMMNSHTRHCIKDTLGSWDSYVGGETVFNKQYYIYNFNLPSYDNKSVIGITIEPGQRIRACHLKDDSGFSSAFKDLLKAWEKQYGVSGLWECFQPMTDAEISEKRRRIIANREVIKPNLSLSQIKKFLLDDGADVNAGRGAPIDNAIEEGNVDKVKFLLDYGASLFIRTKQENSVNKIAKIEDSTVAFEILKLVLQYGGELTPVVFRPLSNDEDAVRFCLDNGLKPDFTDNLPFRMALKNGKLGILKLLVERGAKLDTERMLPICWAFEYGSDDIKNYLVFDQKYNFNFDMVLAWIGHSHRLTNEKKIEILSEIQKMIDDGSVTVRKTGYRMRKDGVLKRDATVEEVIETYGSLMNWIIKMNDLKV